MHTKMLRVSAILFLVSMFQPPLQAACIDSVHVNVQAVQCFGLRNGVINISEVFGGKAPFYYSLDGQSYSTRPKFDLLWSGEYMLYVRDSNGCVMTYPVLVPQPEELKVKLSMQDSTVIPGVWVQIKADVYPTGSILTEVKWRPPALFTAQNQLTQLARFNEDTEVAIEVRNEKGCIARDILPVRVEETNLYFPNVFRPGSKQDNYFTLFAGEGVEQIVSMQVYNRAGNLVYEKRNFLPNDPQIGWDGKWRGRQSPAGVYAWVAQVAFLDGRRERFSGNVTLIQE